MQIRLNGGKRWGLRVGVSVTALVCVALLVFLHFSARISEDQAAQRVSQLLRTELSRRHITELRQQQRNIPDPAMAARWQEEYKRLKSLQISEVKLKRPFPDIFLHPDKPTYVVRVVFSKAGIEQAPRYFWLGWPQFDREISSFFWYFSI